MSWNAKRYQCGKRGRGAAELTSHHVPPKHPDRQPHFTLDKSRLQHDAYHALFRAAATFEDAVSILWNDWWKPA